MSTPVPTLKEAYTLLGLQDPLEWEAAQVKNIMASPVPIEPRRQTGTTTLMQVEATLDLMHGKTVVWVSHDPHYSKKADEQIEQFLERLKAGLEAWQRLHCTSRTDWLGPRRGLVGVQWDVVYLDHYVPGAKDERPLPGPYGLIRSVQQDAARPDRWRGLDYDGELVAVLDERAARELADGYPTRIHSQGAHPVGGGVIPVGVGISYVEPVKAVATRSIPIQHGMLSGVVFGARPQWFDNELPKKGDRVLLPYQGIPSENGIYEVSETVDWGSPGNPVMTLVKQPDQGNGTMTVATEGVKNKDTIWVQHGRDWTQVISLSNAINGPLSLQGLIWPDAAGDVTIRPAETHEIRIGDGALDFTGGQPMQIGPKNSVLDLGDKGELNITGSLSTGSYGKLEYADSSGPLIGGKTKTRTWDEDGNEMRLVETTDGCKMHFRNGVLENIEGAETLEADPEGKPLLDVLCDDLWD